MPTPELRTGRHAAPAQSTKRLVEAIAQIDHGADPDQIAADYGLATTTLLDAAQTYHEAGRAAVDTAATETWLQTHIAFADWTQAHQNAADDLAPKLDDLCGAGLALRWWFIRKHPRWRLRIQATTPQHRSELAARLDLIGSGLTGNGAIASWQPTIYEPETFAFGGHSGMHIAHRLFSADSRCALDYLVSTDPPLGVRETSLLLCTRLVHSAGLEWLEIGDLWHRIADFRPPPVSPPPDRLAAIATDIKSLLGIGTGPHIELFADHSPLRRYEGWAQAFAEAGKQLRTLADTGALQRGLRSVLAYHIIFHWNRIGLSAEQQALIAHAAKAAILT
ncbi:thiopeptide-type bacteriocin biosynthesis protein [Glycomyces xiaoerkulensis]|uniref:thiopeptide-type bacteriocin biosynthesis protein n=1 Tax=Glycomyces xiaoerkulensis TaxID=2038139 RepID=UPI0012FFF0E5|nr:thiopeptide-type bacteriocin biosynthesis protein [Glycomyces xiaoerkulensis]